MGKKKLDGSKTKLTDWAHPYKAAYAQEYFNHCANGLSFAEIATAMGIPEEQLIAWSQDVKRKQEFVRAFKTGRTVCQAYHVKLLKTMTAEGATNHQLAAQRFILQTLFPDDWNLPTKHSHKVEEKVEILSESDLDSKLGALLTRASSKRILDKLNLETPSTGSDEATLQ